MCKFRDSYICQRCQQMSIGLEITYGSAVKMRLSAGETYDRKRNLVLEQSNDCTGHTGL
ncbi:MAG: hypothetical protein LBD91_04795 [Prevotellaceae bacterium]|nr:hypothetical protein [Prevotellaceae bacterium]